VKSEFLANLAYRRIWSKGESIAKNYAFDVPRGLPSVESGYFRRYRANHCSTRYWRWGLSWEMSM